MTSCAENLEVLESLRRVRHESATMQGFGSYAERCLTDKMAKTPKVCFQLMKSQVHGAIELTVSWQKFVDNFMSKLQERIKEPYQRDMTLIQQAKQKVEGNSVVEPWDIPFYSGILRSSNGLDPAELSTYLTIPNCVEGMKVLVRKLFGIILEEVEMNEGERWDHGVVAKERAQKFVVTSENGKSLGTMYLDLHPREGKYSHAAHFTVKCGCAESVDAKDFQLPVVALICNLSTDGQTISHSEFETLMHEFGHALHSLLSRTTFQHMSGTRAAMDFVETPSHLLEHFSWDPDFLRLVGKHHLTGTVIPDKMIHLLLQTRQEFKSLELQNQILYSRFDQALFGPPIDASSIEIFSSLYRKQNIPYANGTHWHTRFQHLVTYGKLLFITEYNLILFSHTYYVGAGYYGMYYSACMFYYSLFYSHFCYQRILVCAGIRQ